MKKPAPAYFLFKKYFSLFLFVFAIFFVLLPPSAQAETTFCPIYPIGISSELLTGAQEGDIYSEVSIRVDNGNFGWITWSGSPSAPTLAHSLIPPGDSNTYINPYDAFDSIPEIGEWLEGSPGVSASRMVKQNLSALLGQDIVVPVWNETENSGNNFNYKVENFAVVALSAYNLNGQGWLSFEYKGDARCYNDPPEIPDAEFTTDEDTPASLALTYMDPENDPVEYLLVTAPENGLLTGTYPNLVYMPSSNFNGLDQFTYLVDDGQFESNIATVIINVLPVNDAPVAFGQQYAIEEDQTLDIQLVGQDIDGDVLSYLIQDGPVNGTLSQTGENVTYTPATNFNGDDQFTFLVNDGALDSNVAVINITANPVNDAPVADPASYEVLNDETVDIVLTGLDIDGDTLTFEIVTAPNSGSLEGDPPSLTYIPNPGFVGEVTFSFLANDGLLGSLPAEITIDVKEGNKPPTIISEPSRPAVQSETYSYDVEATDPNVNDVLTYALSTKPSGMTIDSSNGVIQWQPTSDYLSGQTGPNQYCSVPLSNEAPKAADIIVAVDRSGSMSGETDWIKELIPPLNDGLEASNVGVGLSINRYGVLSYINYIEPYVLQGDLMGTASEFVEAANIQLSNGPEDGYLALDYIFENYPLRDGAATNLILVTDEDRDNTNGSITFDTLKAKFDGKQGLLNVVVNNPFYCKDGTQALGIDSTGQGYLVDGQGGYLTCDNATVGNGFGTTERDYVDLALALGGAAWNLNFLRQGGLFAESFSKALIDIKVREVISQLSIPQADLVISNIETIRQEDGIDVQVTVSNRGLEDQLETSTLHLYQGSESGIALGQVTVEGIQAGAGALFTFAVPDSIQLTDLTATIDPLSIEHECIQDNNSVRVPVVSLTATDLKGLYDEQTYALWVVEPNTPPGFLSSPLTSAIANQEYSYQVIAHEDNAGDLHRFTLVERPLGMQINSQTGELTWLPDDQDVGEHNIIVRVTDLGGLFADQEYLLTVSPSNQRPTITSSPLTNAEVGNSYLYDVEATDSDGDPLSYDLSQAPEGMSINHASGLISWTPAEIQVGAQIVVVRVEDNNGGVITQSFIVQVDDAATPQNQPPIISSTPITEINAGSDYQYAVLANDPDGHGLTYHLLQFPAGMTMGGDGNITWAVPERISGTYSVVIQVTDSLGAFTQQNYTLTVNLENLNTPPVISSTPSTQADVGLEYTYTIVASDADGDALSHSLVQGPATMNLDSDTNTLQWTPNLEGIYPVQVTVSDAFGASVTQSFSIGVGQTGSLPPQISSEPETVTNVGEDYNYQVVATDPEGETLAYELISGPTGMTLSSSGLLAWTSQIDDLGVVGVSIKVSDPAGASITQIFEVQVQNTANTAPLITSLPPTSVTIPNNYSYQVVASDSDGDSLAYQLIDAPAAMTVSQQGLVDWTPRIEDAGETRFVIELSDGQGGVTRQEITLAVIDPNNTAPVITSTATASATVSAPYLYPVLASDADGDALTYTLEESPTGMTIDTQGQINWTPQADQVTTHAVTVKVSDGRGGNVTQQFTVTVGDGSGNQIPKITSTPPLTGKQATSYAYQVIASDPDGDTLTYEITQGPATAIIDSQSGLLSWTPDTVDSETFTVRVSDGSAYAIQTWSVQVQDASVVLTADIQITPSRPLAGDTVLIEVLSNGFVGSLNVSATLDGNPLILDSQYQAQTTFNTVGSHVIDVVVSDDLDSTTSTKTFLVTDGSDTTPPIASLITPIDDVTEVTAPIDIRAEITDSNLANWQLLLKEANETSYTVIAEGGQAGNDLLLTSFDPSLYKNGLYDLLLQATDFGGNTTLDSRDLRLTGDLKVGNFSFTVTDLEIPVSGIPIRINRTYDSRDRAKVLDFGYGWSIDYRDIKVEESRAPGSFWALNSYNSGPFGVYVNFCVEPLGDPIVTITLPTGDVESFKAVASPHCNLYQPLIDVQLQFEPLDNTLSTLEQTSYSTLRLVNGNLQEIDQFTAADPVDYKLTSQAGYVYLLNQEFGIEQVIDPNGNTLTYTDDGIFHSDGKSVLFERNGEGLITAIIDPSGNRLEYSRDANGDLVVARDQLAAETTYTYNSEHGLLDIFDPLGRKVLKNIYDDDGRLIAQEDGDGNRAEFNHDIAGRLSVVNDRNGNPTSYYYDDEGNVTSMVDALGQTTSYTYDVHGSQLTETNPLGQTTSATFDDRRNQLTQTDALGNTISYQYNTRGQETRITDARGNVYENTYDVVGNLVSIKAPNGDLAGNHINAKGLVTKTTDLEGNTTDYTYDSEGNKTTETDAEGNTTSYTYDDNGNVLTETRSRTLANGSTASETTSYTYDARNRVTSTTDALGHTTVTEYDLAGNQTATVDALGHRTEMSYDTYGRLTETRYADGTSETKTYDPEGNLLSDTDRAGHTTSYQYDVLNRQVKTTYADSTFTQTEYDAAGRVSANIDENGNRTTYEYDAAGRRTATIDHEGNRHSFEYDADGNLTAEVDAKAHRTEYVYNALDQRIQTIYANASASQQAYDALGRNTGKTDQADLSTGYSYDGLGRLATVTDALSNITSYTYDDAGNKLTQTDAEGRTTRWEYDALGRGTARILPLGQRETMEYDGAGNLMRHTDFNGQLTVHLYDENNRREATQYDDGTTETWTYTATGQIDTATEELPNGSTRTWAYQYDSRDRLIQETQPDGATLVYSYDSAGNKTQVVVTQADGSSHTTGYTYDNLNRLESVTDHNNQITSYGYDVVGNLTSVSHSNGASDLYIYDSLNRLTKKETFNGSGALVQSFDYTLHPTGRRTQIAELGGRHTQYGYDDLYRLTAESITDTQNGNHSASYQYDNVGNRIYETVNGVQTAYSYDLNDRLTQQGGVTYSYDANGNTLSETEDGTTISYSYNAKNQLQAQTKNAETTVYDYDLNGIRIGQADGATTTTYLVDSNRDYAQVLIDQTNNQDTLYTYGHDLLSQRQAGTHQSYYFHYDGLGSTRALTDATGTLSDSYNYEAFGSLLNQTGATENRYLFTGEQYDSNLDQYYLRARYYDPNQGRFTQMDSWMGLEYDPITLNKYLYAHSDPILNTDPSGNFIGSLSAAQSIGVILLTTAAVHQIGQSAVDNWGSGLGTFNTTPSATGILVLMTMVGSNSTLLNLVVPEALDGYGDEACNLVFTRHSTNFPVFSEVGYACRQFPGHVIRRFVPTVVLGSVPTRAPCAPGYPADMMPVPFPEAINGWRECRFRY